MRDNNTGLVWRKIKSGANSLSHGKSECSQEAISKKAAELKQNIDRSAEELKRQLRQESSDESEKVGCCSTQCQLAGISWR